MNNRNIIVCALTLSLIAGMLSVMNILRYENEVVAEPIERPVISDTLMPTTSVEPLDGYVYTAPEPAPEPEPEEEVYVDDTYYYEPTTYDYSNGSGLTQQSGVNYYNGNRETYYSSNVLHHYRTDEWTAGADGVYRDADGYVVVASSDLAQGSTIDTSMGPAKVYDSGCASGTVDVYTNW